MRIDLCKYTIYNFRINKSISGYLPAWLGEYLHEYVKDHI